MRKLSDENNYAHLSIIGIGRKNTGMMSYPNFSGKDKPLQNPDVQTIASLAESVNLDLRIILLYRTDISAMITSYTRRFGSNFYAEAQILISSLANLYMQLKSIDRKFVHCLNFEKLVGKGKIEDNGNTENSNINNNGSLSVKEKADLIDFVHPKALKPFVADMWKVIKSGSSSSSSSEGSGSDSGSTSDMIEVEKEGKTLHGEHLVWKLEQQTELLINYCQEH